MYFDQVISLLESILKNLAQSFGSQMIVVTFFYILIWWIFAAKLKRFRIQLTKRAGWSQLKDEFKNIFFVVLFGVFSSPLIFYAQKQGWTQIYFDISDYGVLYFIFSVIFIWILNDLWFYWTHRLMHRPIVYKYIHAVHHQSLDTTPYTSLSFHYLEPILLSAWIYIVIFVMPLSIPALAIIQVLGLLNNIKSHLGYEFFPKWFEKTPLKYIVNSTHHNLHHTRYNGNYGLFFTFWDTWWGTELENQNSYTHEVKNRQNPIKIIDNSRYTPLVITNIVHETDDTCSLYFEPSDPQFYEYKAGQYINLKIKVGFTVYQRIFSLSSSPLTDRFLRISVKKKGPVTTYFKEQAKIGDELSALYPVGDFYIQNQNKSRYLMIAGGSGITPLFSMIRTLLFQNPLTKITLLYASRDENNTLFYKELRDLENTYSHLTVQYFISGKERIGKADIEKYLDTDTQILICGPETLKKSIKEYMSQISSTPQIQSEDFADGFTSIFTVLRGYLFRKSYENK